ncbi:MAG: YceI family protein [Gallionella sp.]|nr:YceI family protein [Gallionella sp.]
MKKLLILPLLLAGAIGSAHAVEFNQVQLNSSMMTFAYKQMGVPLEGKFRKFTAQLTFDPARINAAQAKLEVDLASIDTGSGEGDDEVAGKLWFNTKAYPAARFVSGSVKALGGNRYETSGKLTIKGRTLDVAAPFAFRQEGKIGIFDGAFTLKRLDYAIGEGLWADVGTVADEVRIVFHIVTNAAAPIKK